MNNIDNFENGKMALTDDELDVVSGGKKLGTNEVLKPSKTLKNVSKKSNKNNESSTIIKNEDVLKQLKC